MGVFDLRVALRQREVSHSANSTRTTARAQKLERPLLAVSLEIGRDRKVYTIVVKGGFKCDLESSAPPP